MNKYLALFIAVLYGAELNAQTLKPGPRLVVNIAIDQLRTDYLEHFSPLYGNDGFRRLLEQGCVYESPSFPFSPVDRASAIASIATGTTPRYNGIAGMKWLDRNTLRPVHCTDDAKFVASPARLTTSTIGDELKISTQGSAVVYSIAYDEEAAILSAGHAADAAFWRTSDNRQWTTSAYYGDAAVKWIKAYSRENAQKSENESVISLAGDCISTFVMGRDNTPDLLSLTLSAKDNSANASGHGNSTNSTLTDWQTEMLQVYVGLDRQLATLITNVEQAVGRENVLFVLSGTGYTDEPPTDYARYHVPTGTFHIDRTANLLNMYLVAVYGQGRYVEACAGNQIYLNRKLIEDRHITLNEVISRAKDFLVQNTGVSSVSESPYSPTISGDLIVDVTPGWQLIIDETGEQYTSRTAFVPFPVILYGAGTPARRVTQPVSVCQIAPTIARAIRIRAPNACSEAPLP